MRKSTMYLSFTSTLLVLFGLMFIHAAQKKNASHPFLNNKKELVKKLELTDLCLFTEARYARHPSQADRFSAFQEHPLSMEHFPSGSLIPPPESMRTRHTDVD